jgi:SEFIR domain
MEKIKVFISYSWDGDEHRAWVKKFVDSLEEIEEITTIWDGYDLDSLIDKNYFMEDATHNADFVVAITTSAYKAKADERKGGVGIETFLMSTVHWKGLLKDKRSKVISVQREPNSTPRYLEGHFHLDFTQDSQFSAKFKELERLLQSKATIERPKKRRSLTGVPETSYDFTRVEELIQVTHPNRRAIVTSEQGTDFSGSYRVKYELWETKSPAVSYFLALLPNGTISHIVRRAAEAFRSAGIQPSHITVLRPRAPAPGQELVAGLFVDAGITASVDELTYKEYIWTYCIDQSLKAIESPSPIENYTNQALSHIDPQTGSTCRVESAVDYLVETLMKPSKASAHMVVAPGGMGKTSLCLSVAKKLHFRDELRSSVILIQAESIKKYVAERGIAQSRIHTIYDIYEIYAKLHGHGRLFDRSTFDLAVVCGNLTVIIDGLDELASLFQEQFELQAFMESLKQLHDQLGSSNVLLTTRNNLIAEDSDLEALGIEICELLGFDTESCQRYVGLRLAPYPNAPELVEKVMTQIAKQEIRDSEGRIIPFLADICATVVVDGLKNGKLDAFDVSEDKTPYASNNTLTDHIVHSMLRREITRHKLEMSEVEVVDLISELVADFGKRWPIRPMLDRLRLLYDVKAESISSKLELNPLLVKRGDDIELRYSFLSSHFEVLLMLRALLGASVEEGPMRAFAKLAQDSEEAQDLKRYFSNNHGDVEQALHLLIPKLREKATATPSEKIDSESAKRAMAGLLQIFFSIQKLSIEQATEKLLSFFGIVGSSKTARTLTGLQIKGNFPPLDFTNLIVTQSRFQDYRNLMHGRFKDTKFMYSNFENCADLGCTSTELQSSMIDSGTCTLGDLHDALEVSNATKVGTTAMITAEVEKFLGSFYSGDRFGDKKVGFIKYSNKVQGLAADRFSRLVAKNYFVLAKSKTSGDFYEVSPSFKASVRKFLSDGYPDAEIRKFIEVVK